MNIVLKDYPVVTVCGIVRHPVHPSNWAKARSLGLHPYIPDDFNCYNCRYWRRFQCGNSSAPTRLRLSLTKEDMETGCRFWEEKEDV